MRAAPGLILVLGAAAPLLAIGPPVHTDTPITLGLEGRGVRTFAKVTRASRGDDKVRTTVVPLAVPVNVTARGVVGISVPTVFRQADGSGESRSSSGLGDASLFAKYVVLQVDRPRETLRLAPKLVLKLPTGEEEASPALGSGSTDLSVGAVAAWLRGRLGIYVEGAYVTRGDTDGRRPGNGLNYDLALAFRVQPSVYRTYPARQTNAYLELNGAWTARDRTGGAEVPGSGGHVVLLSPGVQYIPVSRLLVEASLQVPLVRNLRGSQPEPDWVAGLGTRLLLF